MDYFTILAGLGGGVCWALIGLIRSYTKKDFEFDIKKFLKSIIVGGVVGSYIAYTGGVVDTTTIEAFLTTSAFATPIVGVAEKATSIVIGFINKIRGV